MYLYVIKFTFSFLSLSKSLKFSISNIFRFLFAGKNETNGLSDSVVKLDVISRFRGYFDHDDA